MERKGSVKEAPLLSGEWKSKFQREQERKIEQAFPFAGEVPDADYSRQRDFLIKLPSEEL